MIFLIDFENVSNDGFTGVEKLTENDKLIMFYSEKSSNISVDIHCKLEESKAVKEYLSVKTGGKNALDFQLSTYIGYLIATDGQEEYTVVSRDNGFNFVVEFWRNRDVDIRRSTNLLAEQKESVRVEAVKIEMVRPEPVKRKVVKVDPVEAKHLKQEVVELLPEYEDEADKIVAIVEKLKTKQGVNNALLKEFGSENTGVIYKAIRTLLKDKKGK